MRSAAGQLFIFYGLLKQGAVNAPAHIPLLRGGEFLGSCAFHAQMFSTGDYPGVRDGDTICKGHLYRLDDPTLLPLLDEFEDCDMSDPAGSLYQRRQVAYFDGPPGLHSGLAWVYWYIAESNHFPVVSSGEWAS